KFGLGEHTGIELDESIGQVASPENREKSGGTWYPGDTLQAAIGQSDNLFTPAQLANYLATILNKGKRQSLHLLDKIVDYDTGDVVHKNESEVIMDNPISEDTYEAIKEGMRKVVTEGTARAVFSTSKYKSGGKTGTAEVSDGADNVLYTGFAPYDDPEIVVAVVIEHGASSAYPAKIARDVFDAYMDLKEKRKDPDYKRADKDKDVLTDENGDKKSDVDSKDESESDNEKNIVNNNESENKNKNKSQKNQKNQKSQKSQKNQKKQKGNIDKEDTKEED
ncbi:MAG: penicillin-binding transpeptidase domain-containing protein, partial [Oscillospiraceae bacterium]